MKTSINSIASKLGCLSQVKVVALAAVLLVPAATVFGQSFWRGGTSDYNVAASWTGPYNSGNPNCCNDTGLNNVVLIQPGDPPWIHGDTLAGQGSGAAGAYLQTGSTNGTGYPGNGNWLRLGIGGGGTVGYYTLSNGVLNVAGRANLGENGTGTLEIDGGVFTSGYNGNPGICAGNGDMGANPVGTLILNGGSITNISNETWFGEGSGTGTLYMSNGTFTVYNWFVFGRNGGNGTGIMTGGTINMIGGGNFLVGGGGNGSLTQSGGTINCNPQFLVPQQNAPGTYTISGNAVLNVHDWLAVGRNGGTGQLTISDSASITRDNNNDGGANFTVGSGGPGTVTQNGGAITNLGGATFIGEAANGEWDLNSGIASLGTIDICVHNGIQGTLNLNGGLLQANGITSPSGAASFSAINFNGGTVQATANNVDFISALSQAYVTSSGVIFDSQAYNITIPQALLDNGGGTLTKNGSGTLTLTGANTYAGATTVNAGTLETTTASIGAGSYTVASGATLSVQMASADTQLSASSLSFGGPNTPLNIDLNTFGVPSSAPVNVAGTLTANGAVTVNILASAPVAVGPIPLIQYGSPAGLGTFVLGNIPPGDAGYLTNSGGLISLVITNASEPRWTGNVAGGVWDIGTTANWFDLITATPTIYQDGKPVLFDDNATGTTTVNLNTTVKPGSVAFNNKAKIYTLQGSGVIGGTTGLTVEGSNYVYMNLSGNTNTGPTVLDAGTLVVTSLANGGSPSSIGASSSNPTNLVLAGGTLSYTGPAVAINRGYELENTNTNGIVDIDTENNLTLSGTVDDVPGSGFVKSGPAQLTYAGTGTSTLADSLGYTVAEGTVAFAGQTNTVNGNLVVAGPSVRVPVPAFSNAFLAVSSPATLNISFLDVGDSANGTNVITGTVTQTGGSVVAPGGAQIGQFPNGVGIYNLSGGSLTTENWFSVGRQGGVGTFNLSGTGVLIATGGGNFDIGNSGGVGGYSGTGVFNQTGGALTNTTEVWLGEGASGEPDSGTWNMSGGTAVTGEVHVGVGGTGTSTLNVSGSASITESYLLLANYDGATTGNVNVGSVSQPGGTITVNADMDVGGQGNGTLNFVTNGGGKVTVTGTLYLSRFSATADGTVNLNAGGTLIAGYINNGWGFQNNLPTPTSNPNAFNFNGGTLQAYTGSPYFIQPYVNVVVQSGGAIINDGGFSITVLAPLVSGGGAGGLTKQGNGTLILNGVNTYTGTTLVSAGTLAVGASGSIAGPVTVASGATLAADTGSIQTTYINNTLTLAAGSTTSMQITPSSNDQIAGLTGVNYGGALVVTNSSGSLLVPNSVFQLFHSSAPGGGNFSSITILPYGAGTFNPATGLLTITSVGFPAINPPGISGGKLILTGTGGTAGSGYTVLSSTNVATPLADWVTNTTGTFNGTGGFSNAIPVTNKPALFFEIRVP